jgi:hypothetical protein
LSPSGHFQPKIRDSLHLKQRFDLDQSIELVMSEYVVFRWAPASLPGFPYSGGPAAVEGAGTDANSEGVRERCRELTYPGWFKGDLVKAANRHQRLIFVKNDEVAWHRSKGSKNE